MAGAVSPETPAQTRIAPLFRGGSDLVVLQVSVLDAHRRFVRDLGIGDFAIYEEGIRQDIQLFASGSAPLDLMVLLDTSLSMTGRLELAQKAAIKLLRTMREGDRASVVLFNTDVRIVQGFTADTSRLEAAVEEARPAGATALYEAIYVSLRELVRARHQDDDEPRRQAMVVLSDGDDTSSRGVSFDDLLEEARRRGVTMFTILPSPPEEELVPDLAGRRLTTRYQMRQLANETGGRAFRPATFGELNSIYHDIATELGQQYWLAYAPATATQPGFRRVAVRLDARPALSARTRSGYYASGSGASGGGRPRS